MNHHKYVTIEGDEKSTCCDGWTTTVEGGTFQNGNVYWVEVCRICREEVEGYGPEPSAFIKAASKALYS